MEVFKIGSYPCSLLNSEFGVPGYFDTFILLQIKAAIYSTMPLQCLYYLNQFYMKLRNE